MKPTEQRQQAAPPIDVKATGNNVPAVRGAAQLPAQIIEPDLDQEIDAALGIPQEPVGTGFEVALAPHFKVATPFPRDVQDAIRAYRMIPDEMIDIKENGQIYVSNRHASAIFDEVFGIGGWALVPIGKSVAERKRKGQGTSAYEIITVYQNFRAYALGQYIRDVSGAGTYFSNNAEQNYSDAVEAAESYAMNRFAKRLGIGSNVRDPIFAAEWIAKYAFQDTADKNKWKKKPGAAGVPVPPSGSRSWTAALVKLFTPVLGEDPGQLADALEKLTTKAWGVDKASRSFRDLSAAEAYELCRRIAAGELTVPTIAPKRASEKMAEEIARKWPIARREAWAAAHEGQGKPPCQEAGCKLCDWDGWELAAEANVQVVEEAAPAAHPTETSAAPTQQQATPAAEEPKHKCSSCKDEGCAMCIGSGSDDEEIPPSGDRAAVEASMHGTLCPKPRHGRYHGLFCPVCADPSLLDEASEIERSGD